MCTRTLGVRFGLVGLIVVATIFSAVAADATAKTLPRYKFEVGEQLSYKGQSDFKYDNNSRISSADWRITVVDKNPEAAIA